MSSVPRAAASSGDADSAYFGLQKHYVDGEFRESAARGTFTTVDPATENVLAEVADGRAEDVDAAVRAARRAFDDGPWPHLKAEERAAVLERVAALIRERAEGFVEREVFDIGMPITQMRGLAARAAQNFDYYAGVVRELARPVVPGRRRVPQLHDPEAGRRGGADHALERAADAVDVAARARSRCRQHGRPQAGRMVTAVGDLAGGGSDRDRPAARCLQRRPRAG